MFAPQHDFFVALNNARKAARRNDISTAERWLKAAERHMMIAKRLQKLASDDAPKRETRPPCLRA